MQDFHDAIDRAIGGLEKKNDYFTRGKANRGLPRIRSCGSRMVPGTCRSTREGQYCTPGIVALGYAQYLPKEQFCTPNHQLIDEMCMSFGGVLLEDIVFNKISTGLE